MLCFKRLRKKINFAITTSCFSLFSLGFSSFVIGNGSIGSNETNLNFSFGKFITGTDYISLNLNKGNSNTGIEMFEFNSKGFVKQEKVVYDASIVFYLKFDALDFYTAFPCENINFKFTLKYANEFKTVFTLLTSACFDNFASSIRYYVGNTESEENTLLTTVVFDTDDINKEILGNFSYSFNDSNMQNSKFLWMKLEFCFKSDAESYNSLYQNELSLANNKPKYVLNMEI